MRTSNVTQSGLILMVKLSRLFNVNPKRHDIHLREGIRSRILSHETSAHSLSSSSTCTTTIKVNGASIQMQETHHQPSPRSSRSCTRWPTCRSEHYLCLRCRSGFRLSFASGLFCRGLLHCRGLAVHRIRSEHEGK